MLKLKEDLKNQIYKNAYLLYGEEPYLQQMYRDRIIQALVNPEDTMNLSRFSGKNCNPKEIIDLAETMPFFAEHRVILLEDTGFFKGSCEELASYIPQIPESTCLIFVESELDKRGKLYKAVHAGGGAAEFRIQTDQVLAKWIVQLLRKDGKQIAGNALQLFLTKVGTSMNRIQKELEKLTAYAYDRDLITVEDVNAICCELTQNQIFKMVDAIALKEQKQALTLYYDLLALKEPPLRILFLIVRQFNILMQIKSLGKKGFDQRSIGKKAGIPEFAVRKNMTQAKNFTLPQIYAALRDGVQLEQDVKSGKLDPQLAVELLIVKETSA